MAGGCQGIPPKASQPDDGGRTEAQSTPDLGVKGEPAAGALGKIGLTSTSGLSDLG